MTLTAEQLPATELAKRTQAAAQTAFAPRSHPIAQYFFTIEHGMVVRPALHAPLPLPVPREFLAAEHQELGLNQPGVDLESYRKLIAAHTADSLALRTPLASLGVSKVRRIKTWEGTL